MAYSKALCDLAPAHLSDFIPWHFSLWSLGFIHPGLPVFLEQATMLP